MTKIRFVPRRFHRNLTVKKTTFYACIKNALQKSNAQKPHYSNCRDANPLPYVSMPKRACVFIIKTHTYVSQSGVYSIAPQSNFNKHTAMSRNLTVKRKQKQMDFCPSALLIVICGKPMRFLG